jgi:hypothetical protein
VSFRVFCFILRTVTSNKKAKRDYCKKISSITVRYVPAEFASPEPTRFPPVSAIFKPTRRKPGHSPDPARLVSDQGTKAAPLVGSGNRECVILSVCYGNVSAALSLLNKVYNSIYSKYANQGLSNQTIQLSVVLIRLDNFYNFLNQSLSN